MERISEALKRARQARGNEPLALEEPPNIAPAATVSTPAVSTPVVARRISYTATRSVAAPRERLADARIVTGFDPCAYTDAFKVLSTQVSQRLRAGNWNTLAVTSANEHEGKTVIAINVAASLAAEFHQTALLVDADLRRCEVRKCFGWDAGPGLSDHLLAGTPVEKLLVHPGIPGLVVLPGGEPLLDSSELLGSRQMADLVRELKERYRSRIVVFDLPPLLAGADVLAFAPHVEAALLVVEDGKTLADDAVRAAELLAGTQLIGTVLNKSAEATGKADRPYPRAASEPRRASA